MSADTFAPTDMAARPGLSLELTERADAMRDEVAKWQQLETRARLQNLPHIELAAEQIAGSTDRGARLLAEHARLILATSDVVVGMAYVEAADIQLDRLRVSRRLFEAVIR